MNSDYGGRQNTPWQPSRWTPAHQGSVQHVLWRTKAEKQPLMPKLGCGRAAKHDARRGSNLANDPRNAHWGLTDLDGYLLPPSLRWIVATAKLVKNCPMSNQLLPRQHGTRRRYYTPEEVAAHNSATDAWVTVFFKVFDLTDLITTNRDTMTQALICNAGRDVSHWFDGKTMEVKSYYSEDFGIVRPYVPMGRFLHVQLAGSSL